MLARRALAPFASVLALVLSCLAVGCEQSEHAVLIEARTQGYVETLQVTVIDLDGSRPPVRTSPRPVRRDAADVNEGEPIRIAIPLPGPMNVLVHVVATGRERGQRYVATRCYATSVGVVRDTVLLVGPIGADLDADGDGFPSDPGTTCRDPGEDGRTTACDHACPSGVGADCNDGDPDVYPGAPELCRDGIDQNCDGVDVECEDRDGDGWRSCSATDIPGTCDCDDNVAEINPGATEQCRDGVDQNCDGRDGLCDLDGDGFESDRDVGGAPDCDDTDPAVYPGAMEVCTAPGEVPRDEDCNGFIDDAEGCTDDDLDRDGWPACTDIVPGAVCARSDCDCNDCDAGIHPGALDRCGNGIDEDQDGADAPCPPGDADGDGFVALAMGGVDCDDTDPTIYPGAPERCGDGIAQSCIADVPCDGDDDGDGFVPPADCGPFDVEQAPGATELCNMIDDDCDGTTNEVLATPVPGFPYGTVGCVLGDARLGAGCAGSAACEIDFRSSVFHCGGCRVQCNRPGGPVVADVCVDGTCDCSSEPGLGACTDGDTCCLGAGCRDLASDFQNCGFCGVECTAAADRCLGGTCSCGTSGRACTGGTTCCGETCVDTATDENNCGACGNVCGPNSTCQAGRCTCDPGFEDCDANQATGCEVDLRNDPSNCGACRNQCIRAGATAVCVSGMCRIGSCNPGRGDCDTNDPNGCEIDLTSSAMHCGMCGASCGVNASCASSACVCSTGFGNCDGAPGCETDIRTSVANCGMCGHNCGANSTCTNGMCGCAPGFDNCDGMPGCETNIRTSVANCGMCGRNCGPRATCSDGDCVCNDGWGDCNNSLADGCETNIDTSAANCGMCGRNCGANSTCSGGGCVCNPGWGDCNNSLADGCETNTDTSTANCGMCGRSCGPNATCSGGGCVCNPGWDDCNSNPADGCEVNLDTSPTSCGMCGHSCGPNATCSEGGCVCNAGWDDCNGSPADGCETNTDTSATSCGTCGRSCGPRATCSGGSCVCNAGWDDCNGSPADGCEANLDTSIAHCGACNAACGANEICSAGSCTCASGFEDCNDDAADGCEIDTRSTLAHCGGCAMPCDSTRADSCVSGSCRCGSGPQCPVGQACSAGTCS